MYFSSRANPQVSFPTTYIQSKRYVPSSPGMQASYLEPQFQAAVPQRLFKPSVNENYDRLVQPNPIIYGAQQPIRSQMAQSLSYNPQVNYSFKKVKNNENLLNPVKNFTNDVESSEDSSNFFQGILTSASKPVNSSEYPSQNSMKLSQFYVPQFDANNASSLITQTTYSSGIDSGIYKNSNSNKESKLMKNLKLLQLVNKASKVQSEISKIENKSKGFWDDLSILPEETITFPKPEELKIQAFRTNIPNLNQKQSIEFGQTDKIARESENVITESFLEDVFAKKQLVGGLKTKTSAENLEEKKAIGRLTPWSEFYEPPKNSSGIFKKK